MYVCMCGVKKCKVMESFPMLHVSGPSFGSVGSFGSLAYGGSEYHS